MKGYNIDTEILQLKQRLAFLENNIGQVWNEIGYIKNRINYLEGIKNNANIHVKEYNTIVNQGANAGCTYKNNISERNIGKYLIGILASILILVSVSVFLGLIWESITPVVQFIIIFGLGIAMSIPITYIMIKKGNRNGFTLALSSCGIGVILISLLLSYLVWHLFNLTLVAILYMTWFCGILYCSNKLKSNIFYIVAHLGSVIALVSIFSVDIGYYSWLKILAGVTLVSMSLTSAVKFDLIKYSKIVQLVFLFIVSIIYLSVEPETILGLNIFGCFGIIASILLIHKFDSFNLNKSGYIYGYITEAMLAILITIYGFAWGNEIGTWFDDITTLYAVLVLFVINILISVARSRGLTFLLYYSVLLSIILLELSKLVFDSYSLITGTGLIIIAITLYFWNENKEFRSNNVCDVKIILNAIFIITSILSMLSYIPGTTRIMDSIIMLIAIILYYAVSKNTLIKTLAIIYMYIHLSYMSGLVDNKYDTYWYMLIVLIGLLHRHLVINRQSSLTGKKYSILNRIAYIPIQIYNYTLITIAAVFGKSGDWCIALILLGMALIHIYDAVRNRNIVLCILSTILCNINIIILSTLLNSDYYMIIMSVLGITIAAIFIVLGFKIKLKSLRICGLASILLYVAKIVLLDSLAIGSTIVTAVMIFIGGLVCFGISYIYNKLDKTMNK